MKVAQKGCWCSGGERKDCEMRNGEVLTGGEVNMAKEVRKAGKEAQHEQQVRR